jgi:hypothetical protein
VKTVTAENQTATTSITALGVSQNNVPVNSIEYVRVNAFFSGISFFVVGIVNSTGNYTQGSIFEMSPNVNMISCSNSTAVCDIWTGGSETIYLTFWIQVPPSRGDWKFEAVASIAEPGKYNWTNFNNFTLLHFASIQSTVSRYPFTIHVYDTANVAINIPSSVTAEFDGAQKGPGSFQVSLAVGSNHSLTIPAIMPINETSRFSFVGWTEAGYGVQWAQLNASLPSFTIRILGDANLTASYTLQYKVTVTDILPVSGYGGYGSSGWYQTSQYPREFSTMTSPQPTPGILGQLGFREVFDGWYVNGEYLSNSTDIVIPISQPLLIEARWRTDYTLAIVIFSAITIEIVALIFMILRRTKMTVEKESR